MYIFVRPFRILIQAVEQTSAFRIKMNANTFIIKINTHIKYRLKKKEIENEKLGFNIFYCQMQLN